MNKLIATAFLLASIAGASGMALAPVAPMQNADIIEVAGG